MENHTGREIEGYKKEVEGPTMYDDRKGRSNGDGTWWNKSGSLGGNRDKQRRLTG